MPGQSVVIKSRETSYDLYGLFLYKDKQNIKSCNKYSAVNSFRMQKLCNFVVEFLTS